MNEQCVKNFLSVQEVLNNAGLTCKVVEFSSSTRTASDAAASVGCAVGQIVKSLIFKTKYTHKPVLLLVSGKNKVSEKRVELYLGEAIIKSDADFAKKVTGYAIGGVPPIGHKERIDFLYIDQDIMLFDAVWAAAGTANSVFCIRSKDLLTITQGVVISMAEPEVY